jgi:hypothetical protein
LSQEILGVFIIPGDIVIWLFDFFEEDGYPKIFISYLWQRTSKNGMREKLVALGSLFNIYINLSSEFIPLTVLEILQIDASFS